ncbi:TetR/AcrR family transcriptional regulator [Streptomyces tubercidicus]|uniref:TetR family transcriptional regulator n=1 Tax=Streptomyces tubercidicus TaxID=47759 RepID=A0A640UIJ3_9ACTN|nr:TetR/AcrR family transcriptional regulator [Streptomyces tubercidicus]WAU10377.1 TetR/AcrR family transcriptional regulator [Streptomyces tubercidicus]GFE35469.1 TetR family transcriptional regulator [Streptomyces tubercidicus]
MAESERVPVERKRRRPTSSGVVLSADLIVDAACELIDAQGAQAFTVRKLGAALGADPSAIYRYFRNTEDLLLALADRLIGESMTGFAPGGDWAADLRELGLRAYRSALRHPQIAVFSTVRVTGRPHEQRAVDTGIGLLLQAGFDEATAVRHYHALVDTALGHAAVDAGVLRLPPAQRAADEQAWQDEYANLPADDYPNLHRVRDQLPQMGHSAVEPALDLLVAAMRQEAAQRVG